MLAAPSLALVMYPMRFLFCVAVAMADRAYTLQVVAYSDFLADFQASTPRVYAGVGILLSLTISCIVVGVAYGWRYSVHVNQQREQTITSIAAARRTHNVIVGYVCHELRNPVRGP